MNSNFSQNNKLFVLLIQLQWETVSENPKYVSRELHYAQWDLINIFWDF